MKNGTWFDRLISAFFPHKCIFCGKVCADLDYCGQCHPPFMKRRDMEFAGRRVPNADGFFAPFFYIKGVKKAVRDLKFNRKRQNAVILGEMMAHCCLGSDFGPVDFVTCIPQSEHSRRIREYNQSRLLAERIADVLGFPFCETMICLRHSTEQKQLTAAERAANIFGSFQLKHSVSVKKRSILLVDDVMTTGSTLSEATRVLKSAGAKEVFAVCAASVVFKREVEIKT
ncbi:MAG TPA: phosphoribosyltransferase family protein [Oscillospiraceae bacterium]|nr:phosphoribosyltransferase family protein [Oscillospiraceae bacterium]HPF55211.1 phosphoribosyltransferase family protein [Clostridiales bacterium]HPK36391.1 phosphoribosyltransferase family protein [Oscillospiraceae bacterium]HPR76859.1 phosphoribosyltransferase family protein [Oscillospiraceae bacterium]